jgi:uroporphyrin-III C-methyltransferase
LNHLVELHDIKPPTLVIIGDVINTFDEKRLMNLGYLSPE